MAAHERRRELQRELAYISADLLSFIANGCISSAVTAAVASDRVDSLAAKLAEYTSGCEQLGAEQARLD